MKQFQPLALIAILVFACSLEPSIDLREYDVAALQRAMQSGELRSQDIVSYWAPSKNYIMKQGEARAPRRKFQVVAWNAYIASRGNIETFSLPML